MIKILQNKNGSLMWKLTKPIYDKYGYEAIFVENDDEFFDVLKKEKINLVTYDIDGGNNINIIEKIKEISPETKFTVITSNRDVRNQLFLKYKGLAPFIRKPCNEWNVIEVLDHYLPGTRRGVPFEIEENYFARIKYEGKSDDKKRDRLLFEYQATNFFTFIACEKGVITDIEIHHHVSFSFSRCQACGTKGETYSECPSFFKQAKRSIGYTPIRCTD
jgi:two-component SAPR family response regulator